MLAIGLIGYHMLLRPIGACHRKILFLSLWMFVVGLRLLLFVGVRLL